MNEIEPSQGDSTPRPDPTLLTTQQLDRGLAGLEKLLNVRIDGLEKALAKLQSERDMFPTRVDEKITATDRVHAERFTAIGERFDEARDAVAAAFLAANESVRKSEAMTTKIIDQQSALIASETAGLRGQIADLKDRLSLFEGTGRGREDARTNSQATGQYIIAIIGIIVGTLIGAAGLLFSLLR